MIIEDFKSPEGLWRKTRKLDRKIVHTTRAGSLWSGVIARAGGSKSYLEKFPVYEGVTNDFKCFQSFTDWCHAEFGYFLKDKHDRFWNLDKDILVEGNKSYSESTCCFIPTELNSLFLKRERGRGQYPIGVIWHKSSETFVAACSHNGKPEHIGCFSNPLDAHRAWQEAKIRTVRHRIAEFNFLPEKTLCGLNRKLDTLIFQFDSGIETT